MNKFLTPDWCNLNWSAWTPFDGGDFKALHGGPGLYRIRVAGSPVLAYIGQTGRDLRQRLGDLRRNTAAEQMPFNDPHTAAPSLWAWNDAEGYKYECSVAPSNVHRRERLALECWLLWNYRLETGGSTLCNYGHFHPAYTKSKNRSTKLRGGRRDDEADRVVSSSPLRLVGRPAESGWMGLDWSSRFSLTTVPAGAYSALYRIFDAKTEKLLYIGETQNFGQRMKAHAQKNWNGRAPVVSYHRVGDDVLKVHLHELESDGQRARCRRIFGEIISGGIQRLGWYRFYCSRLPNRRVARADFWPCAREQPLTGIESTPILSKLGFPPLGTPQEEVQ